VLLLIEGDIKPSFRRPFGSAVFLCATNIGVIDTPCG
jgi:hypothetical protein